MASESPTGTLRGWLLIVTKYSGRTWQIITPDSETASGMYYRIKNAGSWTSWQRCDNFGCNTASDLASLLGVLRKSNHLNLDDISYTSFNASTDVNATFQNTPPNVSQYGVWITICIGTGFYNRFQLYFDISNNNLFERTHHSVWDGWRKFI